MTDRSQITVGEPVAWQGRIPGGGWVEIRDVARVPEYRAHGYEVRPLYTHPPSERVLELVEAAQRVVRLDWSGTASIERLRAALSTIAAEGLKEGG